MKEHTTISDLLTDVLTIPMPQQGRRERLRVAACLRRLGWVEVGKSNDVRRWGRGPKLEGEAILEVNSEKPVLRLVPPLPDEANDEEMTFEEMGALVARL